MRTKLTLKLYQNFSAILVKFFNADKLKLFFEYSFWKLKKMSEGTLTNHHYEEFFTYRFNLEKEYYKNKIILDIGCGPRGSLEWSKCSQNYGLDPLAEKYRKLGTDSHKMKYITATSENIPFDDNTFDVVSSFNSLDHVQNLTESIAEIKRVLKKNGLFLLISDIHTQATISEPSAFGWDITEKFTPEFEVLEQKSLEGNEFYKSIRQGIPFDFENETKRYGILMVKFLKK